MPSAVERYLAHLPYIAAQRGAAWGYSVRRVFAADPDVGTAYADVWPGAGDIYFPPAAVALEIFSDSADDSAAGTGARTVVVEGLDSIYDFSSEEIVLNGVTPALSLNNYLRVNQIRVKTAGSIGQAVGTISLREAGAGPVLAVIQPGPYNVGQASNYTVPRDSTAYIVSAKYSSDDVTTRFSLTTRGVGEMWRVVETFQVAGTPVAPEFVVPVEVTEKTDIKLLAVRPTAQTALALVSYDLILMPKTLSAVRSLGRPAT